MPEAFDIAEINRQAAHALSMCRRGDVEQGLAAYSDALQGGNAKFLPVSLHARMLAGAGQKEAGERLILLGLRNGADISTYGALGGALNTPSAHKILEDYRELIRRGQFDTIMVDRYLSVLAQVGEFSEIGRILDPALIRSYDLVQDADRGALVDPAAIADVLMANADAGAYRSSFQSIRNSVRINHVDRLSEPVMADLFKAVRDRIAHYCSCLGPDTHAVMTNIPAVYSLETWCVISYGEGYTVPHKHSRGWLTGVFYPAAPPEALVPGDSQGALCVGRQDFLPQKAPGWQTMTIAPIPGSLVLMPSYAVHWTEPLRQPGLRISIAIDVCAEHQAAYSGIAP